MQCSSTTYSRAVPAYLGSKRRLAPVILALTAEALPFDRWGANTLLDPFCGSGSVALHAKAMGFEVVASDVAARAVITARALIANSTVRLTLDDVLDLFSARETIGGSSSVGALTETFPAWQAEWFINAIARATDHEEPVRSLLLLLIVKTFLRCLPMSLARVSDAHRAAADDFDLVTARRTEHYLRTRELLTPNRLWAIAKDINGGVFGGRGEARTGDAVEMIARSGADVLYLDPPYAGTAGYRREYRLLDELLGDGDGTIDRVPPLDDLLAAAAHIPVLVVSYGGPRMTVEQLAATVSRHRRVRRTLTIPHPRLNPLTKEASRATHQEFLVLATV